jgi:3-isopropylmalate/(R)-2-methylmalate dehydratase small subunit
MEKFVTFKGLALPLDMAHVDTDQIVPKQFLKRVQREGFGEFLFHGHRFDTDGELIEDFILHHPRYAGAEVLLTRENFGSGSSREHAPWALMDYGFRAVIAPSFADIFKGNCAKIGLLTIELDNRLMDEWFKRVEQQEGYTIEVDLKEQALTGSDGFACFFTIDPFKKHCLINGLDEIGLTLENETEIAAYEQAHAAPWQAGVAVKENQL